MEAMTSLSLEHLTIASYATSTTAWLYVYYS